MLKSCVAASGYAMNSIGVCEVDLWIKRKKITHPVNVIIEVNNNIIGMNLHKLTYDVHTRQVKFPDAR
jgi:hypothetical protein